MYLRGKSAFADQLFDHDPCWLQQWECDEADHSRRRYEPRAIHVPRPDAAGVRLRQVYAELGGMIGGSRKSESCMLFPKILDTVRAAAPSQAA
jgi:hypothetical protein